MTAFNDLSESHDAGTLDIEESAIAFEEDDVWDLPHEAENSEKVTWYTYFCKITSGLCPS